MEHEIRKQAYTLIGLLIATSTLASIGAVSLYKIDTLISEYQLLTSKVNEVESRISSRYVMDKGQNDRLTRIEDGLFVPRGQIESID